MSDPIYLPAGLIATPSALPRCCARHGLPATVTRKVNFYSRPEPWTYLLLLFGIGLVIILVISMTRKHYLAPAWPFCTRCQAERRRGLALGWGIGLGGTVVASGLGFALVNTNGGLSLLLFLVGSAGAPLTGAILGSRGAWATLAGGVGRRDGGSVTFARPADAFVAALPPPGAPPALVPAGFRAQQFPPPPAVGPSPAAGQDTRA